MKKFFLIQGKKFSELKGKLRQILVDFIFLVVVKVESEIESIDVECREVNEIDKSIKFCDGYEVFVVYEDNKFNENDIYDGVNLGKVRVNLLQFKMKKWNMEGVKVIIVIFFMDKFGLVFIMLCLDNEIVFDKVYIRVVCVWNNKKID